MGDVKIYERTLRVLTDTAIFVLEGPEKISNYVNKSLERVIGPMWDFASGYNHLPENRVKRSYSGRAKKPRLENVSMN